LESLHYTNWNILDWFLVVVVLLCTARGIWRGGVSQVFGILGVLGGFFLAVFHYASLGLQLERTFPSLPGPGVIAFLLLFFLAWFCFGMAGYWLGNLLRSKGLGLMDRSLGGLVGFGKALLLAVILVSLLTTFAAPESPLLARSRFAPHVELAARFLAEVAPQSYRKAFEIKRRQLRRSWSPQQSFLPRSFSTKTQGCL